MTRPLPLRKLVDPRRPITYGIVQAGPNFEGGVPYIRPIDMTDTEGVLDPSQLLRTSPDIARAYARASVAPGDVVLSIGPSYGKVMVVPTALAGANLTQGTARLSPGRETQSRWLFWALQSTACRDYWDAAVGGATFRALNLGPLGDTPMRVPPLDEQRRITDFLDDQVSSLDALVALRLEQQTLLAERFEGARESAVGGCTDARHLTDLVEPSRPINYGVLMPGPSRPDGIALVEAGDVMRGRIRLDGLRRTDPVIEAGYMRSRLRAGDLVMAIRGSVGRVQVIPSLPEICNVTRDAARISIDPQLADSRFVRHALQTRRAQDWLRLRVGGSAVQGINIGDLRKVKVPVPALGRQHRLADVLDNLEATLEELQESVAASRMLIQERKRALISAAVTSEFDVSTAGSRAAAAVTA